MATQHISPGVYSKIIDLSTYLEAVPGNAGFIPFFSRRGPDNELRYITSQKEFSNVYGAPDIKSFGQYSQGKYIVWNHLGVSGSFYALRCLPESARYANLVVEYNNSSDFDTLDSKENVKAATTDDVDLTALSTTIDGVTLKEGDRVLVKDQTDETENGIYELVDSTTGETARTSDANSRSELENAYVYVEENEDSNTNAGKGFVADVLDPGDVGTIDITFSEWTGDLSVWRNGNATSLTELESSLDKDDVSAYPLFVIHPIGRGDSYHDLGISLRVHDEKAEDEILILSVYQTQSNGQTDEVIETYEVSLRPDAIDEDGESIFLPEVINNYSTELRVIVNETNIDEFNKVSERWFDPESNPSGEFVDADSVSGDRIVAFDTEAFHLGKGSENGDVTADNKLINVTPTGRRVIANTDVADSLLIDGYTGLLDGKVLDQDEIYFPLVYDGGYPTNVKQQGVIELVKNIRRDCVAICDIGDNYRPQDALKSMEENNPDSFLVAFYEPYSKVFDPHTGRNTWVSPVYHMSSMIPQNDRLYNVWTAAAGFRRGTINTIKELRYNPDLSWRDRFYKDQINPIVKFSIGYTIWGQLTSQNRSSSLQDLNVVRTVLYIKRTLEQYAKWYIFEFNTPETWQDIHEDIAPFLDDLVSRSALETYSLDVGATDYEKKQKRLHINVTLKPVKVIERIEINLKVK